MSLEVRLLSQSDIFNGFLDTLAELSPVDLRFQCSLSRIFEKIEKNPNHLVWVIVDYDDSVLKRVVGTISLLVEQKFIHRGGRVAHIEDLVVMASHREKGLGSLLVGIAVDYAKAMGCYKVILDCGEHNVEFYEKLGFRRSGVCMRFDLLREIYNDGHQPKSDGA